MRNITLYSFMIFLVSCSTTSNTNYIYTGGNEFSPVVIKIFEYNNIEPKIIDIIKNEIISHYIYQINYGAKIRYKLKVKYTNHKISVELDNIQLYSFNTSTWLDEKRYTFFDNHELPKKIAFQINKILNNQTKYNLVKNEVYNNFLFHYLVLKNLSQTEKENWVKNHMLERQYDLNVTLSKFEKNTTGIATGKHYIAEFTNTGKSSFNDLFVINYFTNNKNFLSMNTRTPLVLSGKLVQSQDIADLLIHSSHVYLVEN